MFTRIQSSIHGKIKLGKAEEQFNFYDDDSFLKSHLFFREPARSYTPFMEAAAAGHEIIVQSFLQHVSSTMYI